MNNKTYPAPTPPVLLAVLNNQKHLMNKTESQLLWDYYFYLSKGKPLSSNPQDATRKLTLADEVWQEVRKREESGEKPLSELADLKWRVSELEKHVADLQDINNNLVEVIQTLMDEKS